MNDQIMNEGFWSVQNKVWLRMAMWMEWIRPFLYCLLAMALLSLLWTFVNLVLLCRKELPVKHAQKKTKVRTKAEPAQQVSKPQLRQCRLFAGRAYGRNGSCLPLRNLWYRKRNHRQLSRLHTKLAAETEKRQKVCTPGGQLCTVGNRLYPGNYTIRKFRNGCAVRRKHVCC